MLSPLCSLNESETLGDEKLVSDPYLSSTLKRNMHIDEAASLDRFASFRGLDSLYVHIFWSKIYEIETIVVHR